MGLYKHLRENWKNPEILDIYKKKMVEWRKEPATIRIEKPTRLDRAHSVGYRAKQGFVVVRQRVMRGGRLREKFNKGRRPRARRRKKIVAKNYQRIAEERANKQFKNCEVLNSYYLTKDGIFYWYEIILVDRSHPSIMHDERINWIMDKRGRACRGLTSAGRKSRGLRGKGTGREKMRPSLHSNL